MISLRATLGQHNNKNNYSDIIWHTGCFSDKAYEILRYYDNIDRHITNGDRDTNFQNDSKLKRHSIRSISWILQRNFLTNEIELVISVNLEEGGELDRNFGIEFAKNHIIKFIRQRMRKLLLHYALFKLFKKDYYDIYYYFDIMDFRYVYNLSWLEAYQVKCYGYKSSEYEIRHTACIKYSEVDNLIKYLKTNEVIDQDLIGVPLDPFEIEGRRTFGEDIRKTLFRTGINEEVRSFHYNYIKNLKKLKERWENLNMPSINAHFKVIDFLTEAIEFWFIPDQKDVINA